MDLLYVALRHRGSDAPATLDILPSSAFDFMLLMNPVMLTERSHNYRFVDLVATYDRNIPSKLDFVPALWREECTQKGLLYQWFFDDAHPNRMKAYVAYRDTYRQSGRSAVEIKNALHAILADE
jgi:hypothetical protein